MPGLDERRDDIEAMVDHFCAETCRRHGLGPLEVSPLAAFACREAPWPGHVRELAHAIEAACIRAAGDRSTLILEHHIFHDGQVGEPEPADGGAPVSFQSATRRFQARYLREALERNDWNVARTGRELGLARSHLYTLLHEFRIKRDAGGIP
jgi:Nif-specific regulatory protein